MHLFSSCVAYFLFLIKGPIVVTFEIHGGSPIALSAALHALEALVESGVPLQVGADTYPILPLSLRLGSTY